MPEPPDAPLQNPRQLVFRPDDSAREIVAEWVARPALRQLVETLGGTWPADPDLEQGLLHLVEFSRIWDHRRGGSRLDVGDIDEGSRRNAPWPAKVRPPKPRRSAPASARPSPWSARPGSPCLLGLSSGPR